ncbi:MAG: type IV secretion system protein VirB10 [Paucibacter sp.]|nr:type IV secretion system protein VirB10 [Roseateles sp.]
MNERPDSMAADNSLSPLSGEPGILRFTEGRPTPFSRKGLLAVLLLMLMLIGLIAVGIHSFTASGTKADDGQAKQAGDRPSAASTEPRKLEMPASSIASSTAAASTAAPNGIRVPALLPTADEMAEPIGVRRTAQTAPSAGGGPTPLSPQDAPVLLLSSQGMPSRPPSAAPQSHAADDPVAASNRNLQDYERQLQGLLDSLTKPASPSTPAPSSFGATSPNPAPSAGLFGGQLQASATARVSASMLGDRSLILPKGTAFTCALKTKIISAVSGLVGCQVQRHVYSDDGKVLLIERGSHMDGEYRIASVRPGMVRIPVLWTRIRTPHGVTVDIESPGTGPLGESGIDGHVDNRWLERIGAAMLLSLINDSVRLVIQSQTNGSNNNANSSNTVLLPSTAENSSKLAEKVLDSTINIPPLIYQNQGGIVGIYVARDVDFSAVYQLKAVDR